MNNKNRIISMLLIIIMIAALLPQVMFGATISYEGMPEGSDIIKNASFTDIKGDANIDSILKMAVYSVIREYGSTTYRPKSNTTREEMLAALIRAVGKQTQAVQLGENIKKQNPEMTTTDAYLKGHVEAAKGSGIIANAEIDALSQLTKAEIDAIEAEVNKIVKSNWKITTAEKNKMIKDRKDQKSYQKTFKTAVTREEAALWIARALNLKPVTGEQTMSVYSFSDWKSLKTQNIPFIEASLRSNIIKGATPQRFSPSGNITKSELASILNELTSQNLDKLGYAVGYGKVIKSQNIKESTPYGDRNVTQIEVQEPEGDNINIVVNNKNQALPVIKDGKVGNQVLIQAGDIVEYTTSNNNVLLLYVGKYREIKGTMDSYNSSLSLAHLTDTNGKKYALKVLPDTIVKAQGAPVDISKVEYGTPMTAIYTGSTLKSLELMVSPDTINTQVILAKILFADPMGNIIKIADENGNRQYLYLNDNAAIYINDEPSSVDAIGFDQDALITVSENRVTEVQIFTDIPMEEEDREIIFTARVREMVGDNLIVTTDNDPDNQTTYIVDSKTTIVKGKEIVSKSKIKQGDRIKAYVNSYQDNYIVKLEIQGEGLMMKNLYKGDIKEIITHTGEVVMSNVYVYGHYDWIKVSDYMKVNVANDSKIFRNNTSIKLSDLRQYMGKTVYAASKDYYGDEELVHIVLKEGFEDALYKKIKDIKWTANQMTLSDGRLINFTEGSIIIKDGRLLDTLDLAKNSGAFIIQNKSFTGIGSAPVISLDSFNGFTDFRITKGYLHNMGEDYYSVENSYRLTNNVWDKWGELNFYMSDDTFIMDNVVTNGIITADVFARSRFKPYTYTWPNYAESNNGKLHHEDDIYHKNYNLKNTTYYHEHCLLYTLTDSYGNTQAINIFKKDKESFNPLYTHNERMIAGKISLIDSDNDLIQLKQVMDYSPVYETWQPINAEVPIDTARTIIIKNDKVINISELKNNDDIYVLSNDGHAIFIIVQ